MNWFEITTEAEAQALKPYYFNTDGTLLRPQVGDRVKPSAGCATVTAWPEYPEADRLTFDECMAIVRDEVTVEVMREVGRVVQRGEVTDTIISEYGAYAVRVAFKNSGRMFLAIRDVHEDVAAFPLTNLTATKLRILAAILKGEKI